MARSENGEQIESSPTTDGFVGFDGQSATLYSGVACFNGILMVGVEAVVAVRPFFPVHGAFDSPILLGSWLLVFKIIFQ